MRRSRTGVLAVVMTVLTVGATFGGSAALAEDDPVPIPTPWICVGGHPAPVICAPPW